MRSGALLRGEVLARWHDVVGTGDLMRALESRVGRLRDRLRALVTGAPAGRGRAAHAPCRPASTPSCVAAADRAAERAAGAWRRAPGGPAAARGRRRGSTPRRPTSPRAPATRCARGRARCSSSCARRAPASARPPGSPRSASTAPGSTVMIAVFASTGGLTGAEIVVAGGTSALGQKVLEAVFGDQAVRTLAARARERLLERVERAARRRGRALRGACSTRVAPAPDALEGARRGRCRDVERRGERRALDRAPRRARRRRRARPRAARRRRRGRRGRRRARAGVRLGLGVEATVVALAGPTGAGKSTLFNALAGAELTPPATGARPRRRRPRRSGATSATPCSTGWRSRRRHQRRRAARTGSCCSTCPTSTRSRPSHRIEVDRVVGLADLWCGSSIRRSTPTACCTSATCARSPATARRWSPCSTRPTGSTPAACGHASPTSSGLLAADGLAGVPVLAALGDAPAMGSTRCATSCERACRARARPRSRGSRPTSTRSRRRWRPRCGGGRAGEVGARRAAALTAALGDAAGVPAVVAAVAGSHRAPRRAGHGLAVRALGPAASPGPAARGCGCPARRRPRSCRPARARRCRRPRPVQRAQVDAAARALAARAAGDLPQAVARARPRRRARARGRAPRRRSSAPSRAPTCACAGRAGGRWRAGCSRCSPG